MNMCRLSLSVLVIAYGQEHVVTAIEEIGQSFFQTCVIEVLAEEPVTDAVPEATVGVVVGVLAELDDVVAFHQLHPELLPVDLGSFGIHLKLERTAYFKFLCFKAGALNEKTWYVGQLWPASVFSRSYLT
jgi:hypothetical protein